jgi:phage terminase small subunit
MHPCIHRYRAFCNAYLQLNNATQAAIEAGYSRKTAYSQGQRLLKKVEIIKIISEMRKEFETKCRKSREDWIKELEYLAFSRLSDVCKWGPGYLEVFESEKIRGGYLAAVARVTEQTTTTVTKGGTEISRSRVSVTLIDKLAALVRYGMARGFFKDEANSGKDGNTNIQNNLVIIPGKMDLEEWQKMAQQMLNSREKET